MRSRIEKLIFSKEKRRGREMQQQRPLFEILE